MKLPIIMLQRSLTQTCCFSHRQLDKARAVDAEAARAAPKVGCVDQRLGDGDIVCGSAVDRQEVGASVVLSTARGVY